MGHSSHHNRVLFEFLSLIDLQMSIVKYVAGFGAELTNFDVAKAKSYTDEEMKRMRKEGPCLTDTIIKNDSFKGNDGIELFRMDQYFKDMIKTNSIEPTLMQRLVKMYHKAGSGIISTAVRCDNDIEAAYVRERFPETTIELCEPAKVDMEKYGRIVASHFMQPIRYRYKGPRSIVVLDFRENFTKKDSTLLHPELIISLGDIHSITVAQAHIYEKESINNEN